MDIGDIIFLLIMGIGFLSSLGSASKKKRRANKPTQPQRPERPATPSGRTTPATTRPTKKSRLQEARDRAMSQMEDLLRDLEGGPQKPLPTPKPLPLPQPDSVVVESYDLDLPPAVPVAREMPDSIPAPRDGSEHKMFHDKYIKPVGEVRARSTTARARRHLSPGTLREAILLREILGPPKALD